MEKLLTKYRPFAGPAKLTAAKEELKHTKALLSNSKSIAAAAKRENTRLETILGSSSRAKIRLGEEIARLQRRLTVEEDDHLGTKLQLEQVEIELKRTEEGMERMRIEFTGNLASSIDYAEKEATKAIKEAWEAKMERKHEKEKGMVWKQRCEALLGMLKGVVHGMHEENKDAEKEILDELHHAFGVHLEHVGRGSSRRGDESESEAEMEMK